MTQKIIFPKKYLHSWYMHICACACVRSSCLRTQRPYWSFDNPTSIHLTIQCACHDVNTMALITAFNATMYNRDGDHMNKMDSLTDLWNALIDRNIGELRGYSMWKWRYESTTIMLFTGGITKIYYFVSFEGRNHAIELCMQWMVYREYSRYINWEL